MTKVQIRQSPASADIPDSADIREEAASLAAELRKEPGVEVEVVDGQPGELTVSVDGREVVHVNDQPGDLDIRVLKAKEMAGVEGGIAAPLSCRLFVPDRAMGEIVLRIPITWDAATRTAYHNRKP